MLKLDSKDKQLLYWLDQNSRLTNKELGRKIKLSEQGIKYRLNRLEELGIIKKYITFVNTLALGYSQYKVYLRLQNITPQKEEEIIEYLTSQKKIRWVASCSGNWDITFSLMVKSTNEFINHYRTIEEQCGDAISEKSILILVKASGFTKGYFIGSKSMKTLEYEPHNRKHELDEVDKKILGSLSQHARKHVVDIAKEVHTSVDIVRYRMKNMESEHIISGYTTILGLDTLKILRYSVFFSLHKMNSSIENSMTEFARINQHIIFIGIMIGMYDLSLEFEVESHENLEQSIKKFREQFADHIKDFEIILNTKEYKYDFFPF